VEGSCEHGNEPLDSIKCWEVLVWLQNRRLLKKGSAPSVNPSEQWVLYILLALILKNMIIIIATNF
jgi:hypothetical protein